MSDTIIIIPVYNEKDNIERLVSEIFRYAPDVNLLIVDDNSPDGTGVIADRIAKDDNRVSVMYSAVHRESTVSALKEALKRQDVHYIMEMDADFSHDPKYIPEFLKEAEDNDIVIGSRFVKDGRDEGRSFLRKLLSRTANYFVRNYLGLKIKDCTSGYRCFKRHVISSIDLDSLISRGPAIIEEIMYIAYFKNFRIREMPIILRQRKRGRTKLNARKLSRVFVDITTFKEVHLPEEKREKLKEMRRFGFSLALAMNILGAIVFYRSRTHFMWFTAFGCFNLTFAILYPSVLTPIKKILDNVILIIGQLVNVITSLVAFYLIFTPIALLLRLFGKDFLNQRIDRKALSYWTKIKKASFLKASYEQMG
ncbi:polyprenol monophosphomannose synthase [Candidatus Omnitrophota bacterium]